MAAVAPPLSVSDQPQRCIEQLLSIISQRDTQIRLLQEHLRDQLDLCKLRADRAAQAEANALAAHNQLLHAPRPPPLSPADLAALNALPPAERDAAWLRRVFVRGRASPPVGPYEVAGLYVDAFFWSGTAARPDAVVAAVARVFPGVELVPTECGPRFRGLARAQQVAPAVARVAEMERAMPSEPAAVPLPSSLPTSSPASSSYPSAASIAKRRDPPEPTLEPTSKRVRSAPGAAAPAPAIKCEAPADAPVEEQPLAQLQWFGSAATHPAALARSAVDAANRAQHAPDDPNELRVSVRSHPVVPPSSSPRGRRCAHLVSLLPRVLSLAAGRRDSDELSTSDSPSVQIPRALAHLASERGVALPSNGWL